MSENIFVRLKLTNQQTKELGALEPVLLIKNHINANSVLSKVGILSSQQRKDVNTTPKEVRLKS